MSHTTTEHWPALDPDWDEPRLTMICTASKVARASAERGEQ